VLDTTELLECVLGHLAPKQIFGVQRVARLWKDVIARSLGIQEKLFLKLQNEPAELWAVFEYDVRGEENHMKVRMEKITPDVKPNLCYGTAGGRNFTPVALNPFLQLGKDYKDEPVCNQPIWDRARHLVPEVTQFCDGLAFNVGSSLLDTHVSDPPCMRAQVAFSYLAYPPRPGFHQLETCFAVQTGDALTMRDVVAETWVNVAWAKRKATVYIYDEDGSYDQDEQYHPDPDQEYDDDGDHEALQHTSLANIIQQLEAEHECKVVFDPSRSVVRLDSHHHYHFGPFPVVPTETERQDVVVHDKDAYAALMAVIEAEKKEREAAWRERFPSIS
jgi:hypothetical protein